MAEKSIFVLIVSWGHNPIGSYNSTGWLMLPSGGLKDSFIYPSDRKTSGRMDGVIISSFMDEKITLESYL